MPELPDVEILKRYVDATSLHRRIDDVMVRERLVVDAAPQTIRVRLRGSQLTAARRHGKHLFLHASDGGWLRLHFGMTGTLEVSSGDTPEHTELRVSFRDGRHLAYVNRRKFGEISWVDDVDAFVDARGLGPDPLADDVDRETFGELIGSRRGTIKGTLMNQEVLAGLGNVYVDEILFQAGIHPESATEDLDAEHLDRLFDVMDGVIEGAIGHHADPDRVPDDWLLGHREPDLPCPRGSGRIANIEVTGRTTYLCPEHQERIG